MSTITHDNCTPAQDDLLTLMMHLSEDCYMAGWAMGLEYILWRAVLGEYEKVDVSKDDAIRLKSLSDAADGWWMWSQEDSEQKFVTLAEWEVEWESYVKAKGG